MTALRYLRVRSVLLFQSSYCIENVSSTTMLVLLQCIIVIWEIVPIYGSCSALWRYIYRFQNWIQCDRDREGRARQHGCGLASVEQLELSTEQVLQPTALGDHGSWLSCLGAGMRAFFSALGPGLSSKCSNEVLDRQLVSAVLRSSVR